MGNGVGPTMIGARVGEKGDTCVVWSGGPTLSLYLPSAQHHYSINNSQRTREHHPVTTHASGNIVRTRTATKFEAKPRRGSSGLRVRKNGRVGTCARRRRGGNKKKVAAGDRAWQAKASNSPGLG